MRMVNDHAEVIKSSTSLETSQAQITMTPEMFSLLSSGVYTFKERAVIRELSCNAVDAQKEAGKENIPFHVHLPTRFEPYFEVRDFGTGLTHDKVMSLYLNYGASTKNDSNDYIGAMGIGSKSPFAIAQSFTVSSYVDGVVNKYSVYLENGIPQVTKLTTNPTKEPNGLAVRVAVADHRISKFFEEAGHVYSYFAVKPESNIEYDDVLADMNVIAREEGVYDAMIHKQSWRSSGNRTEFNVVMGNIAYPVNMEALLGDDFFKVLPEFFRRSVDLVNIYMPIGSVAIAASREALQMNDTTKNVIIEATKKITEAITKDVIKKVNSQPTLMDAAQAYAELRLNSREMFNAVCPKLEWGGVKLDSLEEELLNIRRGIIYAEDGSVIYERDGKGNIKVDRNGNNIPKVDYLYDPVAYVKFNSLESKIRATALSYTQEASMFNIFGAMRKSQIEQFLFVINDRRNKNGTEKTVGRNQILRGACRDYASESSLFHRYNGIVFVFSNEEELDDLINLHKLDKSLLKIVKMSDKEHHYQRKEAVRGVVKLWKAVPAEGVASYKEVSEDLDTIEEPQLYIKAVGDTVDGECFCSSPEDVAKSVANVIEKTVYVFRKANWKKIPEDWIEVDEKLLNDSLTDVHWINHNRYMTRIYMNGVLDLTSSWIIARNFTFNNRKISRGYCYSRDTNKTIFLEGNEDAVEAMFGKIQYVAAPFAYTYTISRLQTLKDCLDNDTKLYKKIKKAGDRMVIKVTNYLSKRKQENFLLSHLDWNKVSPIEVSKFLGFDVKCVPEGTTIYD